MSTLMKKLNARVKTKRAAAAPYKGPDKSSANGNRPLTFPTPYHGGKRRWAEEILDAFGPERECVYVEPFSGSAAVLLANPRPYAREILCDTNPHITNVFRCLAWAPEVTAFWADWPTTHQDLTARHTWLLRWAVDHAADVEADPDFHDPKAAGWWLWGKSNWIGAEFGIVKGLSTPEKGQVPYAQGPTGQGVQTQRATLPTARDGIPAVCKGAGGPTGQGVQAQRTTLPTAHDKMPMIEPKMGGQGVQSQRYDDSLPTAPDKRPTAHRPSGVSAQVDKIPHVKELTAGNGVSAQRHGDILYGGGKGYQPTAPVSPPDVPALTDGMRGRGVSAMRRTPLPYEPTSPDEPPQSDSRPSLTDGMRGNGVSVQRRSPLPYQPDAPSPPSEKMPFTDPRGGGNGVQPQRVETPMLGKVPLPDDRVPNHNGFTGVQSIRAALPDSAPTPPNKRPAIPGHGPIGIQTHSRDMSHMPSGDGEAFVLRATPDSEPVVAVRGQRPLIGKGNGSGTGVQAERHNDTLIPARATPVPLTGDRLRPWFQALAERLYRVIILNRGWQSGLTPTVLQQTRTARKPPVRVLIDPPYKGVGKLYGMSEDEADALAIASWRWAAEHGSREGWRIAYACREGDFDAEALALGWTCSKMGISANHSDSTQEVVWFSPHCLRGGRHTSDTASGVAQPTMFDMGET